LIAQNENIQLRQRYTRTLKKLSVDQRFRNHARNKKKAIKADRRIKIIAGRLVRELERVLPSESQYLDISVRIVPLISERLCHSFRFKLCRVSAPYSLEKNPK